MKIETQYMIWPRNLDFENLFRTAEEFAIKRKLERTSPTVFTIKIDVFESITAHSLEEFRTCFKSLPKYETISTIQYFTKKDESLWVEVYCAGNSLKLSVDSKDADLVRLLHEQ